MTDDAARDSRLGVVEAEWKAQNVRQLREMVKRVDVEKAERAAAEEQYQEKVRENNKLLDELYAKRIELRGLKVETGEEKRRTAMRIKSLEKELDRLSKTRVWYLRPQVCGSP